MPETPFDSRRAKALRPGEHIVFEEHPGLRLQATGAGKAWTYRYRVGPKTRQLKIGAWPAMGVSVAVEAWERLRSERANGIDPGVMQRAAKQQAANAAKVLEQAARQTVAWQVSDYLKVVVDPARKPKGAAESRRMLTRAVEDWSDTPARELTREQAHQMIAALADAPRVAAMTRQEMRGAWEHGLSRGAVDTNVFAGRTIGGKFKAKARDRHLSDAETAALLSWWEEPGTHSRTVRDALELVLRTGLRSGEVCGIHARELVERGGVLWLDIPGKRMKGGKAHSIPLVGRAKKIVEARRNAGGWLFPHKDGDKPIAQKVLGVEVYACSGRSKAAAYKSRRVCPVKDWAPHDLRRTARTMLAEMGCPFEVGEAILAHQLPGVAGVYARAEHAAAKVDWLTKLGRYLDKLPGRL